MRKLVHLSDLHFGRLDTKAVSAVEKAVCALSPDVLAVSGDLTQRARTRQFRDAAEFLGRLPFPKVVVPGNHDVPLFDVARRLVAPFRSYCRYIGETEPVYEDEQLIVAGLNTARSLAISGGRPSRASLARVESRFRAATGKTRVLVCHHPLDLFAATGRGAERAERVRSLAPDILLAGHLHAGSADASATVSTVAHRSCLLVQGGTATSTRLRADGNTFNVVEIEPDRATVITLRWSPGEGAFTPQARRSFALSPDGWRGTP